MEYRRAKAEEARKLAIDMRDDPMSRRGTFQLAACYDARAASDADVGRRKNALMRIDATGLFHAVIGRLIQWSAFLATPTILTT